MYIRPESATISHCCNSIFWIGYTEFISIYTGTNPYQHELVETLVWTLCTEIHIIGNYMVKLFLVCIPHPVPKNSAMAIGHTHISAVVADGLVLFSAMASADIMFDGCRYCFRTKPVLSHTTKCNRTECSWVIITTPGWELLAWLYLAPCYQRRSWWHRHARF